MDNRKVKEKVNRRVKFWRVSWRQLSPEDKQAAGFVAAVLAAFVWWIVSVFVLN